MADESEDDDPVVHEVDVFVTKTLADRAYLFQYPVRPSFLDYDDTDHIRARIKPKQQRVELELSLDQNSATYSRPRGEQIAYVVDDSSSSKGKEPYFPSGYMDKQVLTSVKASEPVGRYVAGVFKNGSLHLTPIHGFVQLRPSFEYLNKADSNKQATSNIGIEDDNEEEGEAKVVTTRFAKPETDESAKRKKLSFQNIEQKLAEEPWTEVTYYQPTTSKAAMERMLLLCDQRDFESPEFTATSREYLNILAPKPADDQSHQAEPRHGVLSMVSLKKMHIADQIKCLLVNAKVFHFHHLLAILGPNVDEKTVLRGLHDFAVLVQGCWVVKSNILHPKETKCQISGMQAELLWPARDYVLWHFNHKRIIERKDLVSTIKIPNEELRDMLEQVARQRSPQSWEFKLSTDSEFLHKHPDVVRNQRDVWKDLVARFKQSLHFTKDISSKMDETPPCLDTSLNARHRLPKPRSKSRDSTEKSKRNSTDDEKNQSQKPDVPENFVSGLSTSDRIPNISQRLTAEMPNCIEIKTEFFDASDIKQEPSEYHEMLQNQALSNVIVDSETEETSDLKFDSLPGDGDSNSSSNSGPFVPPAASGKVHLSVEKPPSEIFLHELDKFIKSSLKGGCLCLAEFKEILQLRQQEAGNILCSGVSDEVLEQRIRKVGASQINIKWPDNVAIASERKKMFAFRKVGDSMDKYRKVTLDIFSEVFSFRRSELNNRFEELFGNSLSNHMFPRFVGEFCEKYGNSWYLRGTYKAAYPNR